MSNAASLLTTFLLRPGDAELALKTGAALLEAGETELAAAVWTLGDDANPMVRRIKDQPDAPAKARRLSAEADAHLRDFLTGLHEKAIGGFEEERAVKVERVRNGIWPLTHNREPTFKTPMQQPVIFYMPDLPAAPVEPNERFDWVAGLEKACNAIRDEYDQALRRGFAGQPYVPARTREPKWAKLRGTLDWSSIHLYQHAKQTPFAARFAMTLRALTAVDLVRIDGVPMETFFSRLRPGAHIPPHHGLTNSRVTVHLPLIVPGDCAIRVGEGVYRWREGKIIAFDDSYEHEAWNRAQTDRVVLIFEAHHPDLTPDERAAIEKTYSVRQNWLAGRVAKLKAWQASQT